MALNGDRLSVVYEIVEYHQVGMKRAVEEAIVFHLLYGVVVPDSGIQYFATPVAGHTGPVQLTFQNLWDGLLFWIAPSESCRIAQHDDPKCIGRFGFRVLTVSQTVGVDGNLNAH